MSPRRATKIESADEPDHDTNRVVVIGDAARDAVSAESQDGTVYTSFDVVCRTPEGRSVVPVTVEGDCAVAAGQRVAVVGRINKRFFASGAGLSSRTDVRADRVTIVKRRDQVARVIAGFVGSLGS